MSNNIDKNRVFETSIDNEIIKTIQSLKTERQKNNFGFVLVITLTGGILGVVGNLLFEGLKFILDSLNLNNSDKIIIFTLITIVAISVSLGIYFVIRAYNRNKEMQKIKKQQIDEIEKLRIEIDNLNKIEDEEQRDARINLIIGELNKIG